MLLGPTGSGKTPLGEYLEKKGLNGKRFLQLDFGQQLRSIAESDIPPRGFDTKEHLFIRGVVNKGLLLENKHFPIAKRVVTSFLRLKNFREGDILILNGLPRHIDQAKDIDSFVEVRTLCVLDCGPEDVQKRIRSNSGGDRAGRSDDDAEMIIKKLEIFRKRTEPLINYYEKKGCRVFNIKVTPASSARDLYPLFLSGYMRR